MRRRTGSFRCQKEKNVDSLYWNCPSGYLGRWGYSYRLELSGKRFPRKRLGYGFPWVFRKTSRWILGIFVLFTFLHQILVAMDVVGIDATSGTITIFWEIFNDTCSIDAASPCPDVNIYSDQNLQVDGPSRQSQATPSSNQSTIPIFTWSLAGTSDPYSSTPVFKTVSLVLSPGIASANLQNYPFDNYVSGIALIAREVASNSTVGLQLITMGISVGFSLKSELFIIDRPGSVAANIIITRGSLVKAYALTIVVSVCKSLVLSVLTFQSLFVFMAGIITLIFVFTTIYSLLGGYPQRVEFLVIPVATLFTVTQLRTTMPGAPNGFGNSCSIIKPSKRKENLMNCFSGAIIGGYCYYYFTPSRV
ncbi:hypothetical protein BJV78DRAFT_623555 [Lactifluus subvellereus]|nr:hypothetical protein BJV78DRAFT_623555 [Lactifluus subvellereus]